MSPKSDHERYMLAALHQAEVALQNGRFPVGTVIVHERQIIASGGNDVHGNRPDRTRHAELVAIESVSGFLATHSRQCTLYTTLEPCMMCLGAIFNVGLESVVVASMAPGNGALKLLPQDEYYRSRPLQLVTGVLVERSQALLEEYEKQGGDLADVKGIGRDRSSR